MSWYREFLAESFGKVVEFSEGPVDPWASCRDAGFHEPWWSVILKQNPSDLLPDDPFEPSRHRPNGYAMWDAIAANGVNAIRGTSVADPKDKSEVLPVPGRSLNQWWYEYVRPKRARGETFDERFVVDLRRLHDGEALLDDAHVLAHARMDDRVEKTSDLYLHGYTAFAFLQAAAELFVMREYGCLLPEGVYVYPDVRVGFDENPPQLRMPYPDKHNKVFDDVVVCVLVVVELGHDPAALMSREPVPIRDRWAYQPLKMYVAGWETAAWMSCQKVRPGLQLMWSPTPKFEFVSHVSDLLPPHALSEFLPRMGRLPDHPWKELDEIRTRTPMLPCNSCMCYSGDVEGGLVKPREFKPKTWTDPDCEEWIPYRKRLRLAMKQVDAAKKRYYGHGYVADRSARKRGCEEYRKDRIDRKRKLGKW